MDIGREHFGNYLRSLRLGAKIGLREFASLINMQASNYSNIEHGKDAPPKNPDKVNAIADNLALGEGSAERIKLLDLAAEYRDEIADDVKRTIKSNPGIPVLVRTIEGKRLTEVQLRKLTKYIEENY